MSIPERVCSGILIDYVLYHESDAERGTPCTITEYQMAKEILADRVMADRYAFIRDPKTNASFLSSADIGKKWIQEYLLSGERMDAAIDKEIADAAP